MQAEPFALQEFQDHRVPEAQQLDMLGELEGVGREETESEQPKGRGGRGGALTGTTEGMASGAGCSLFSLISVISSVISYTSLVEWFILSISKSIPFLYPMIRSSKKYRILCCFTYSQKNDTNKHNPIFTFRYNSN